MNLFETFCSPNTMEFFQARDFFALRDSHQALRHYHYMIMSKLMKVGTYQLLGKVSSEKASEDFDLLKVISKGSFGKVYLVCYRQSGKNLQ